MSERKTFYHPASGMAILGIDWLFFGLGWELGPVSMVLSCLAAFGVCFVVVDRIQRRWHGDDPKRARAKAFLGAAAAGAPFAVTGTVVGALILVLSGLKPGALLRRPSP